MAIGPPIRPKENKTVSRVLSYINTHLTEPLSTRRLAEAHYVDPSYLCRAFRGQTGATIGEYVSQKRIELALSLIQKGASHTEACYASGFGNYTTFYQACKRYLGKAPEKIFKSN